MTTTSSLEGQNQQQLKRIRVLVAKLGLDGHDRGALVICRALRDAGMEVIYSGLFCTPEQVAKTAIDEDVDAIAMSLLNGAHLTLFPKVGKILQTQGIDDILLVGGGVIPESDKKKLEEQGITGNFGPGTALNDIIEHITNNIKKKRILQINNINKIILCILHRHKIAFTQFLVINLNIIVIVRINKISKKKKKDFNFLLFYPAGIAVELAL